MDKLVEEAAQKKSPVVLTKHRDIRFELSFKYALQKGYTFENLEKRKLNDFQRFLDKVSKMTVQQVDLAFARKPDKNDTFNDEQVLHYAVTDSFRLHALLEEGRYVVLRLDPNHKVHS
jgi:hypothetical protein